ncbi:MAG: flagellar filament capping protein FliD [Candidatus Brocadia sp.]|uniref:Flagellar hook-associated protein 2 n=1 Tax=Candidatus Brocadia fulgida TaxID=380242 RepID=A0A0M2V1T4_9BACT|nr:MAG: flagellar protein [Candidatus Brocadia fulgida]UJS21759.1 MAG: flagellar filament capping protein FliD [Candidatus Brocadia sp.]
MAISSSITSAFNANSGLNLLINQFMALERRPLTSLNAKKTSLNTIINIYSDLKSTLADLQTAARDLASTSISSVYNSRTTSSSDETKLTTSAGTGAAVGTFQIRIKQLATGASIQSTGELITKAAAKSTSKVAPGSGTIDITKSFASAGFTNTPDGTVTINGQTFTLSDYSTVQSFLDAVNNDVTANSNIYYNKTEDTFYIEQKNGNTDLVISETGSNPLFSEIKIAANTYAGNGNTGIQSDVLLNKANFDGILTSTTSGSFKINGITLTYNTTTDTLDSILSKINSSTANVNAFYDSSLDKVILKSKSTGSTDTITLSDVSGNLLNTLNLSGATATNGTDSLFTINSTNAADQITKSTNSFTINGVTYSLKNTNVTAYTDSTYTTITVNQDTRAIQSKITDLLDKFNSATEYIKTKSTIDPITKTRGPLAGNTTFSLLSNQLFQKLSEQITGITGGNPDYLGDIGITIDKNLKASLSDTTKFSNAIISNSKAVEDLFNSTTGIANKIVTLLKPFVESPSLSRDSIIDETKKIFSRQIENIDTRINRMEERLKLKENQYRQQLYTMQSLLNSAVLQGSQIVSFTNSIFSTNSF